MKYLAWIVVLVLLWICCGIGEFNAYSQKKDEPAAALIAVRQLLLGLKIDTTLPEEQRVKKEREVNSYLDYEMDLRWTKDKQEKDQLLAALKRFGTEMARINAEFEVEVIQANEREESKIDDVRRLSLTQQMEALIEECGSLFFKGKAEQHLRKLQKENEGDNR